MSGVPSIRQAALLLLGLYLAVAVALATTTVAYAGDYRRYEIGILFEHILGRRFMEWATGTKDAHARERAADERDRSSSEHGGGNRW